MNPFMISFNSNILRNCSCGLSISAGGAIGIKSSIQLKGGLASGHQPRINPGHCRNIKTGADIEASALAVICEDTAASRQFEESAVEEVSVELSRHQRIPAHTGHTVT